MCHVMSEIDIFVCSTGNFKLETPLHDSGARVFIAVCDPFCALQACFEGVQASCLKSTSWFFQRVT